MSKPVTFSRIALSEVISLQVATNLDILPAVKILTWMSLTRSLELSRSISTVVDVLCSVFDRLSFSRA